MGVGFVCEMCDSNLFNSAIVRFSICSVSLFCTYKISTVVIKIIRVIVYFFINSTFLGQINKKSKKESVDFSLSGPREGLLMCSIYFVLFL